MSIAGDLKYNLENGLGKQDVTVIKGDVSEVVSGLCIFHNLSFDENGTPVEGSTIRVLLSIQTLLDKFTLYKKDDLISMKGFELRFNTIGDREIITRVKTTLPDYNRGTLSLICEFKK
ncbi:MAG: hypothetical protein PHQ76_06375 [Caldisericia bacterium]|nr:hypothetical protein [Caldisericia bacterium]